MLLDYPSVNIIIIGGEEIFSADPIELPSTFRAEMRPPRRGTTTTATLQEILLGAFRTTVTFHPLTYHSPVH